MFEMKRNMYIWCLSLALLFCSCDKQLDAPTQSSMDESVIFSTPALANGAVMGIHQSFGETNSYRGRFLPWYGTNTDMEWYNLSKYSSGDKAGLSSYDATPTNSDMNTDDNAWAKLYEAIERANIIIRGIRTYGNPQPGTEMGQLLGETLTLRAMIYADLTRAWGDVPARFEPITTGTMYIQKSDRDVIYKQLIADLGEAANLCYWPNENSMTTSVERVNKAFVKALRARICMVAAGYSQRPDGTCRRSSDPELTPEKLYPVAKQECLDIINSKTCNLEQDFATVFKKNCQDIVTAGGEALWEIPFAAGRGRMLYTFAVLHQSADKYTAQAKGGVVRPLPTVWYDYEPTDVRRDVTIVPYRWAKVDNADKALQEVGSVADFYFGKFRYEWMARRVTSTNDDGVNKMYMRYAEVYFILAEAINYLEHSPANAKPYLKEILDRAFPANSGYVADYLAAITNETQMFDAIVDQHAFEFCGEMVRKETLIRWNLLGSKLKEAKAKLYDLQKNSGEYADVPGTIYTRLAANGESIEILGLERGEVYTQTPDTDDPARVWEKKSWLGMDDKGEYRLATDRIETLFFKDPDTRQFWPIWKVFIDKNNGMLTNDYGY